MSSNELSKATCVMAGLGALVSAWFYWRLPRSRQRMNKYLCAGGVVLLGCAPLMIGTSLDDKLTGTDFVKNVALTTGGLAAAAVATAPVVMSCVLLEDLNQ